MATAQTFSFLEDDGSGVFDDLALRSRVDAIGFAYEQTAVTPGRHLHRRLKVGEGGESQFPLFGPGTTAFHPRGEEITFQEMGATEAVADVQEILLAPYFVALIDLLKGGELAAGIRKAISKQQGDQLARAHDLRVLMAMVAAARGANATTHAQAVPTTTAVVDATIATSFTSLNAALENAVEQLDGNNVPKEDRYVFVAPAQYYLFAQGGTYIDRDFNDASNGGADTGVTQHALGVEIVKTNSLPRANEVGDSDFNTALQLDYTNSIAVVAHKHSAASVQLGGLMAWEEEWDLNRLGFMNVVGVARGYTPLMPGNAVEFRSA